MSSRVVGWVCDEEFLKVYQKLFYGGPKDQRQALDVVSVWRLRFSGHIPVAIEATARLVEVLLDGHNVGEGALRLMLSAAVVQFVGLITERSFKYDSRPMFIICEEIGIPEWLTDLRHEMAHRQLPSLAMLVKAVNFCLEWLKEKHWDVHVKLIRSATRLPCMDALEDSDLCSLDEEITLILDQYFQQAKDPYTRWGYVEIINKLFSLHNDLSLTIERLCVVLVSYEQFVQSKWNVTEIESHLLQVWEPIISVIKLQSQLMCLLYCLIRKLCTSNSNLDILLFWSAHVVDTLASEKQSGKFTNGNLYLWNDCIKLLVSNADLCMTDLYKKMRSIISEYLSKENLAKLDDLQNVLSSPHNNGSGNSDDCYTVSDVLSKAKPYEPPLDGSKWDLYEGEKIGACSIGLMPGQDPALLSDQLFGLSCNEEDAVENGEVVVDEDVNGIEDEEIVYPSFETDSTEDVMDSSPSAQVNEVPDEEIKMKKRVNIFDSFTQEDWNAAFSSTDLF